MALPAALLAVGMTAWSSPCPPAGKPDMMRLQVSMQAGAGVQPVHRQQWATVVAWQAVGC